MSGSMDAPEKKEREWSIFTPEQREQMVVELREKYRHILAGDINAQLEDAGKSIESALEGIQRQRELHSEEEESEVLEEARQKFLRALNDYEAGTKKVGAKYQADINRLAPKGYPWKEWCTASSRYYSSLAEVDQGLLENNLKYHVRRLRFKQLPPEWDARFVEMERDLEKGKQTEESLRKIQAELDRAEKQLKALQETEDIPTRIKKLIDASYEVSTSDLVKWCGVSEDTVGRRLAHLSNLGRIAKREEVNGVTKQWRLRKYGDKEHEGHVAYRYIMQEKNK